MRDKQQQLLQYIKQLKLPISDSEAQKQVSGLGFDDLNALLAAFEAVVKKEQSALDSFRKENPEEYEKISEWYKKEEEKIIDEESQKKEKAQENVDKKQEEAEEHLLKKASSIASETIKSIKTS